MKIINACRDLDTLFPDGKFDMAAWREYAESTLSGLCDHVTAEAELFDFDSQVLPVLEASLMNKPKLSETLASFEAVTAELERVIEGKFGRSPQCDIILYFGLCVGAGWVTEIGGRTYVLLGIEKIVELDWCSEADMVGLIYHELGHVYQGDFGILEAEFPTARENFLWQLYIEGVAMCFEQEIVGDEKYFHQDKDGWRNFMDAHLPELCADFARDLPDLCFDNQPYFGDWVRWRGHGDAGYYLGAKFVRFIMERRGFDDILALHIAEVQTEFDRFLKYTTSL